MPALHLVFDLDDTLYPERDFAIGGFRAAARMAAEKYGLAEGASETLASHMTELLDTGHLGRLFPLALASVRGDHTPHDLADFVAAYRAHDPEIDLFPDARRTLALYSEHGTLGLITDGTAAVQRSKVAALGIAAHFKSIVYTDALGGRTFSKPHPRAYEVTAAALGKPGDRFVYIGDNPAKDFAAPNALGWTTIMVHRPEVLRIHPAHATIDGGIPHHTLPNLDALASLF